MRKRSPGISLATGLALAVALAPGAGAGKGGPVKQTFKAGNVRYVAVSESQGPGELGLSAACPQDTRLTAGGASTTGGLPDELNTAAMFPLDLGDADNDYADDAYRYVGHTHAFGNDVRVKVVAICLGKGRSHLTYRLDNSVLISGVQTAGNSHSCPQLQRVTGAGLEPGGLAIQNQLERLGPRVELSGVVTETHGEWGMTKDTNSTILIQSHTICLAPGVGKLRYRIKNLEMEAGQTKTIKANCRGKTRVIGGGFGNFPTNLLASTPFDDNDKRKAPDDGWKVRVHADFEGLHRGIAVCLK
jgi:hypothetical protein